MRGRAAFATAVLLLGAAGGVEAQLTVAMVGNAGVVLTDGRLSLLVDLPYESGAFGYMEYDVTSLPPPGEVVSVVTHHHRDHFAPELVTRNEAWRVIAPPSAVTDIPPGRVLTGDSIVIGAFSVVPVRTPHTDDHRSYRIRWRGLVLHFVGDTEAPASLESGPPIDVLFVTPWLSCAAVDASVFRSAGRRIGYHLDPRGRDRICGDVDVLPQGATFRLNG